MRLTKKGFVAWLRSKKATDFVGISCAYKRCPLATYLQMPVRSEKYGGKLGWEWPLRPWAVEFIRAIDCDTKSVTASRALQVLGEEARA